jgi:methyltransferase
VVAGWYLAVLVAVAIERLIELVVARRNAAWSFARGGVESGRGHYPFMVALHTGFLFGCLAEAFYATPPSGALSAGLFAVAVLCQGLRWWVIQTLGPRWNTRVIIVPGLPRVTGGPFRYVAHPNYVAVVTEGVVLPAMYGCWRVATVFTLLNAVLLWVRIREESAALDRMHPAD